MWAGSTHFIVRLFSVLCTVVLLRGPIREEENKDVSADRMFGLVSDVLYLRPVMVWFGLGVKETAVDNIDKAQM